MKILVIDDSKFQSIAIQRALGHVGYDVVTAGDGEAGLRVAREARPDIIILDMMLPKVSGIDVLRALRREQGTIGIPVIVLTGLSDRNKDKLIEEGATAYLAKSEALSNGDCGALIGAISKANIARG